jgi:hypothetical protein
VLPAVVEIQGYVPCIFISVRPELKEEFVARLSRMVISDCKLGGTTIDIPQTNRPS